MLLIGYGNPACEDDGLGPAAAQAIEKLNIEGVSVDSNYQLTVEDAASAACHDVVVFVDAAVRGENPVMFYELEPKRRENFTSHSVDPEAILGLTHDTDDHPADPSLLKFFVEIIVQPPGPAQHQNDEPGG